MQYDQKLQRQHLRLLHQLSQKKRKALPTRGKLKPPAATNPIHGLQSDGELSILETNLYARPFPSLHDLHRQLLLRKQIEHHVDLEIEELRHQIQTEFALKGT
jgi:hypothetical protein